MTQERLFPAQSRSPSKPRRSANGFVSSIWDFPPDLDVSYAAHSIYRWYGTLPGPLVGRLLDLYAGEQSSGPIWDPMMGTGTTLVEGRLRGLEVEGWDVNPLACLISRTKLEAFPTAVPDTVAALHALSRDVGGGRPSGMDDDSYAYARKWFGSASLERLLDVAYAVGCLEVDPKLSRLLLIALASIARDVAEVDARCTHHLVRKKKPYADALRLLETRALNIAQALQEVPLALPGAADQIVRQASVLAPAGRVPQTHLAIVHPPYLGVIHYHLIHRLGSEVLRFVAETTDNAVLRGLELRPEVVKASDVSTDSDAPYLAFLSDLAGVLAESIVVGGRAVVIMGDARHKGLLRHPFTEVIRLLSLSGFAMEENFIWLLQNNGGMHILRRGHHIDHNYIIVFRRVR